VAQRATAASLLLGGGYTIPTGGTEGPICFRSAQLASGTAPEAVSATRSVHRSIGDLEGNAVERIAHLARDLERESAAGWRSGHRCGQPSVRGGRCRKRGLFWRNRGLAGGRRRAASSSVRENPSLICERHIPSRLCFLQPRGDQQASPRLAPRIRYLLGGTLYAGENPSLPLTQPGPTGA
jgi:hypothetical protein